ncbi:hypothetical protein IEQ34_012074 [Dendrobium chrysotoxum]|uniref:Uncharacterized protein n=1 Tax=Dendrobium chrysotoxum TaxID=161865 RepID=A0AAV7GVJ1_DENCH|nr:hypothetical protein IEQ34_012074 [Dendrobium chrysotoxum]
MSKLQRSSVSFRRQGSSGRIWNDPIRSIELKEEIVVTSNTTTTVPNSAAIDVEVQTSSHLRSSQPRPRTIRAQPKAHRCGLSAIFRPCLRPSMTAQ